MIHVQVEVPILGMNFEFLVDEMKTVKEIVGEMDTVLTRLAEDIQEKEKRFHYLVWKESECFLPDEHTLLSCGVRSGSTLILF